MGKSAFIDELEIAVESGDGGDGIVSFLRERARPKGGPNGGDGGKGGDVFMRADGRLNTLLTLRRRRKIKSLNGARGMGKNRQGAAGKTNGCQSPSAPVFWTPTPVAYMPIYLSPKKAFYWPPADAADVVTPALNHRSIKRPELSQKAKRVKDAISAWNYKCWLTLVWSVFPTPGNPR